MNINFDLIYNKYVKYRIIVRNSKDYPYEIQKKEAGFFNHWQHIDIANTAGIAESSMHRHIAAMHPPVGTVVKTYDQRDLLVDKLKGTR